MKFGNSAKSQQRATKLIALELLSVRRQLLVEVSGLDNSEIPQLWTHHLLIVHIYTYVCMYINHAYYNLSIIHMNLHIFQPTVGRGFYWLQSLKRNKSIYSLQQLARVLVVRWERRGIEIVTVPTDFPTLQYTEMCRSKALQAIAVIPTANSKTIRVCWACDRGVRRARQFNIQTRKRINFFKICKYVCKYAWMNVRIYSICICSKILLLCACHNRKQSQEDWGAGR